MKGLDLRKLKKVSSDKNTTTFRHDDGHELKIAHNGLSSSMLKELKGLPMQKMAEGGEPDPEPNASPSNESESQSGQPPVNININAQPQQPMPASPVPAQYVPGVSEPGPEATTGVNPNAQAPEAQEGLANVAPAQPQAPARSVAQVKSTQAQEATEPEQDVSEEQPAQTKEAPAKASPQEIYQNNMEHLSTQNALFANDLSNGHITPETYHDLFAKRSTLGKIGMIFGLMMSGAGSGLSHQQNALLAAMNQEINNDLDAQKQSKNNAQNWLRLAQEHQKILAENKLKEQQAGLTAAQAKLALSEAAINGTVLADAGMKYSVLHNLYQQTNMLPEGPQKAQAQQVLASVAQAAQQNIDRQAHQASLAVAQTHAIGGEQDEQKFANQVQAWRLSGKSDVAEDLQRRHFPGLGEASVPLSQEDRNKLTAGITFQNQLDRFMQWSSSHSGDLNPKDIKEGKALAAGLQGAYRQATNGGVYKSGEQDFISSIIDSDPTKFFNKVRTLPQLGAVKSDSAAQLDQLSKSLGFRHGYASGAAAGAGNAEKPQTATSKSGRPIVMKNGKWVYQ